MQGYVHRMREEFRHGRLGLGETNLPGGPRSRHSPFNALKVHLKRLSDKRLPDNRDFFWSNFNYSDVR